MVNERRPAFSLIELLTVIALIGLLVGLTVPAVQAVRERAARLRCTNNLRQIGLALHLYHETFGGLPPGVRRGGAGVDYPWLGWHARILPFVEQAPLWDAAVGDYARQRNPFHPTPHSGLAHVVAVYTCPSDGRTGTAHQAHNKLVALTNYLGVSGTDHARMDGTLFISSDVRLTDITDGTSNTLMAGERPAGPDYVLGWWYAGEGLNGNGAADMVLGVREYHVPPPTSISGCPNGPYRFQPGSIYNPCDVAHFWSPHPGGANFVAADASVRFLKYSADPILPQGERKLASLSI